jgi:hypothetical protein
VINIHYEDYLAQNLLPKERDAIFGDFEKPELILNAPTMKLCAFA